MASHSSRQQHDTEQPNKENCYNAVDYAWFANRFEILLERLAALEHTIAEIEQNLLADDPSPEQPTTREYYSVPEFAAWNASTPRNARLAVAMPRAGKFQPMNWAVTATTVYYQPDISAKNTYSVRRHLPPSFLRSRKPRVLIVEKNRSKRI